MNSAASWRPSDFQRRGGRSWWRDTLRFARTTQPTHDALSARRFTRVTMPVIGLLVGLVFLAMLLLVIDVAMRQNEAAREQSGDYVASVLADLEEQYGQAVVEGARQQEIHPAADASVSGWKLDRDLEETLAAQSGIAYAFVLGNDERTVQALVDGRPTNDDAVSLFGPGIGALIRRAQAVGPGHSVSGFGTTAGRTVFLTASLIVPPGPFEGHAVPPPAGNAVLLFGIDIGQGWVARVGERFRIGDLHVAAPGEPVGAMTTSLPQIGDQPIRLQWTPPEPGTMLLRTMLPALLVVAILVAATTWLVLRGASAAARRLERTARALEAANAELSAVASTDGLTNLSNRRYFDVALRHEWLRSLRDGSTMALLMIDVDHFKAFNDRFGHVAGDERLRAIAAQIGANVRRPADVAARYGGEEFAVLLPGTRGEGAMIVAEKIRLSVARAAEHSDMPPCSVSIGVAVLRPADVDPGPLLQAADVALYAAKRDGRNRTRLYTPGGPISPNRRS